MADSNANKREKNNNLKQDYIGLTCGKLLKQDWIHVDHKLDDLYESN